MKARAIVTRALQILGVVDAVEDADANDLVLGLDALNSMLDGWSLERLTLLGVTMESFALASAGTGTYPIGIGQTLNTVRPDSLVDGSFIRMNGTDFDLEITSTDVYNEILTKTNAGTPRYVLYDRLPSGGEVGLITLYPLPSAACTLFLASAKPLGAFADLDVEFSIGPGYKRTLEFNLSVELAPVFGRESRPSTIQTARQTKRMVKRSNVVVPKLELPFPLGWR